MICFGFQSCSLQHQQEETPVLLNSAEFDVLNLHIYKITKNTISHSKQ